jgi:tRNA(Ile)-lysidine synthase
MDALAAYVAGTEPSARRYIVAVSGGPDSQALLDGIGRLAGPLGLMAQAVGIFHNLRPEAADELTLARALAGRHGLPFVRRDVRLPARGNVMAQARAQRYRALRQAARAFGASAILVAHTADDQAETVLFHLARGTGLRGAGGMPARRGLIHRPLLDLPHQSLLAHLAAHQIPYATDPTNVSLRRSRGLMRQQLLPALTQLNPQCVQHLALFAARARADDALLNKLACKVLAGAVQPDGALCLTTVRRAPRALWPRVLRQWLRPLGVRPQSPALARLVAAIEAPDQPLRQGALKGGVVHKRGAQLRLTPASLLPARRAGTLPAPGLRPLF